ncbi:hypothetical protein Q31b_25900 [Novipirellula aureliae]|uniref:Uncharacterized protein n=1 Tax=Novipirellula aureliae TaxID=2527966 RepID=A0A5C6E8K0_9BACT|nr:hypothetical protein Q31b_25900 [Novipirellula aureliae]
MKSLYACLCTGGRESRFLSTDTFTAGCIDSYLSSKTKLPPQKVAILRECSDDLKTALSANLPSDVRVYFSQLQAIAELVISDHASRD